MLILYIQVSIYIDHVENYQKNEIINKYCFMSIEIPRNEKNP